QYNGTGTTSKFGVTRFNADGSLDTAFGNVGSTPTGTVNVAIDAGKDIAYAIAVDGAHNKIYLAGVCASGWAVVRLTSSDGNLYQLDTTFSGDGIISGSALFTGGQPNS